MNIERVIVGALRSAIAAHGPITCERIGSAAKRITGQFKTDHAGERLVILVNTNVKMSRHKAAAQAVHAALLLRGVHHGGPVIVLGASPVEIEDMAVVVRDAGRTEVDPGTLTAGATWKQDA